MFVTAGNDKIVRLWNAADRRAMWTNNKLVSSFFINLTCFANFCVISSNFQQAPRQISAKTNHKITVVYACLKSADVLLESARRSFTEPPCLSQGGQGCYEAREKIIRQ